MYLVNSQPQGVDTVQKLQKDFVDRLGMAECVKDGRHFGDILGVGSRVEESVAQSPSQQRKRDAAGLIINNIGLNLGHGPRVVENVHHGSHVRNVRSRGGHLGSLGGFLFFSNRFYLRKEYPEIIAMQREKIPNLLL
jgi:hypothetical protein